MHLPITSFSFISDVNMKMNAQWTLTATLMASAYDWIQRLIQKKFVSAKRDGWEDCVANVRNKVLVQKT